MKSPNDLGLNSFRDAATGNLGDFIDSVPVFLGGVWSLFCFLAMPVLWPSTYLACLIMDYKEKKQ